MEGMLVLPPIAYGMSWHHQSFPRTLSLRPETLMQMVYDVAASLYASHIHKLLVITAHDGNAAPVEMAARQIHHDLGMYLAVMFGWQERAKVRRQAQAAREQYERALSRSRTLEKQFKRERTEGARTLSERLQAWEQQGIWAVIQRERREAFQQEVATRLAPLQQRKRQAEDTIRAAFDACERACPQERKLLRQLEDLAACERQMYELDHAKDQVMTSLKLALANLVMWARDRYFPSTYTQATWHRLAPFFRLPGRIVWSRDSVQVERCPFNDRSLTRDLAVLCQRVEAAQPRLPDGRLLVLRIALGCCLTLAWQHGQVA
jgi:creatinine amidohydrolase/Fe(II)-dependent formamide hydrolase-like protein